MNTAEHIAPKVQEDWWRGAVIYQIYPRSFQDSNGDGIGDLAGIVQRLPHVASLGVDAIWISPFMRSPMADFGYDVSDYCDVDPIFGTLADFDAVIARAHQLGLRVIIDLVFSHTSDQHPWFQASRASRDGAHANWYVWADPKPDGTPPNNWLSVFGGSAWQWNGNREQYYLHNFLDQQPDLNFHEPAVQQALLDVAKFWLDRGVDGFRLDALNFQVHDRQLRDNPPLAKEFRTSITAPAVNPYNHQLHVHDKNQPENFDFLRKLRALLDQYGAAAVGEIGDGQIGLELIGQYTSGTEAVHMCYGFDFLTDELPTAAMIAQLARNVADKVGDGWVCWAFSNHDCTRHASRWDRGPAALRMLVTLMMCLRGSACIYQGEELGLPEAVLRREDLQDPYGKRFWPEFKGRDGCRTPMPWADQKPQAGFSTAARTWLPMSPDHLPLAVSAQEAKPEALIHHYRRAIALRHRWPELARGEIRDLAVAGNVLSFVRELDGSAIFCAFNMDDTPAQAEMPPGGAWEIIGADVGSIGPGVDGKLNLGPWQMCLAKTQTRGIRAWPI